MTALHAPAHHMTPSRRHFTPAESPINRYQAAADRRAFMRMHGNSATPEEMRAEQLRTIKRLRNLGHSLDYVADYMGMFRRDVQRLLAPDRRVS